MIGGRKKTEKEKKKEKSSRESTGGLRGSGEELETDLAHLIKTTRAVFYHCISPSLRPTLHSSLGHVSCIVMEIILTWRGSRSLARSLSLSSYGIVALRFEHFGKVFYFSRKISAIYHACSIDTSRVLKFNTQHTSLKSNDVQRPNSARPPCGPLHPSASLCARNFVASRLNALSRVDCTSLTLDVISLSNEAALTHFGGA